MSHDLIEYLYIDEARLESYFEQISSPVKYDNVPTWKANISLTGPSLGVDQGRIGRAPTRHEKISALLKHLKNSHAINSSPLDPDAAKLKPFGFETFGARRVVIPPEATAAKTARSLALWVGKHQRVDLILIEDFRADDHEFGPGFNSSYSFLESLVWELWAEVDGRIFVNPIKAVEDSAKERLNAEFFDDPLGVLAQLGGRIGSERAIQSLFRIRVHGSFSSGVSSLTVGRIVPRPGIFAYPIFIQESAAEAETTR